MRFYRGNEYGYEISQKNGSWYHRVTWLHVVSPVLENDNEEERSTWNRGKPAFDKLDSIKQHFFFIFYSLAHLITMLIARFPAGYLPPE